jgi:hypothetical protein
MRTTRPRPGEIDPRLVPLDDVFARALSLDPAERPQEADELGRALRKFLAGLDMHDVARELGDRVRELRVKPLVPPNTKRPSGLERPASKPSAATIRTKTFAARDVVKEWAPTGPGEEPERTRRITSERPPPVKPAPAEGVETIATRPLESGPRGEGSAGKRRGALWTMAGAAVIAAVGTGVVVKTLQGTNATPVTTATATVTGTTTTAPTTSATASAPTSTSTTTSASTSTADTAASASAAASAENAAPATMMLTGDPGTTVVLDGTPRGACPVEVQVKPGNRYVVFTFPATGEHAQGAFKVASGEHVVLRASFTGATPLVSMSRR